MKHTLSMATIHQIAKQIAHTLGPGWAIDAAMGRRHYIIGPDALGVIFNPARHEAGMLSITAADCAGGGWQSIGIEGIFVDPGKSPRAIANELQQSFVPAAQAALHRHRDAQAAAHAQVVRSRMARDRLIAKLPFAVPAYRQWDDGFAFTYSDGDHYYPARVTVEPHADTYCINGTGGYTFDQAVGACVILADESGAAAGMPS